MNYDEAIKELEKCLEENKPKCFSGNGYSGEEQDAAIRRLSILSGIIGRLGFEKEQEKLLNSTPAHPMNTTIIVTLDEETADRLGKKIPNSVVVKKVT